MSEGGVWNQSEIMFRGKKLNPLFPSGMADGIGSAVLLTGPSGVGPIKHSETRSIHSSKSPSRLIT